MEKSIKEEKNIFLEFLLALFFLVVVLGGGLLAGLKDKIQLSSLSAFEFTIIALAVFRLTRLFVYDGIMQYVRELCLIKESVKDESGAAEKIVSRKPTVGLRKVFSDLLACPWCVGVWMAAAVIALYYLVPISHFLILVLAVAGLASFIQITINGIGWKAEKEKIIVENKEETILK